MSVLVDVQGTIGNTPKYKGITGRGDVRITMDGAALAPMA
jgi:hypothetical protein